MAGALSYWKRVHHAAFKRAIGDVVRLLTNLAITGAGISAVVWGLSVYGSEDAAMDEIIGRSIIAGVGGLGLALLYLIQIAKVPADWDLEKREQIEALNERLKPHLVFEFNKVDNKHLELVEETISGKKKPYTVGKVAVRNVSAAESVERAEVTLVNCRGIGDERPHTVDRKLIAPSIGLPILDVHARRAENFCLFRVRAGRQSPTIHFGPFPDGTYRIMEAGRYVVKTTASAFSTPHTVEYYLVGVDARGRIEFEPCPKDLDISQAALAENQ